ncbi:MAG TPA: hypothetical protein VFD58_16300 [Blastocatellia bacterium]|nr:hypothetical protein [Blastocatellia bacterium]
MRKAIGLKVTLWIEGEDEPAHNFAKSTKQAVRDVISAGLSKHPELKITIKGIREAGSGYADTEGDDNKDDTAASNSAEAAPETKH